MIETILWRFFAVVCTIDALMCRSEGYDHASLALLVIAVLCVRDDIHRALS